MPEQSLPMRWGRPDDAERIADYHHACWQLVFEPLVSPQVMEGIEPRYERWRDWLSEDSDFVTVVAVDGDDQPIGHTTVKGNNLVHLFVEPGRHGQGLGPQLLEVGERLIRRSGHDTAELHTIVGNARAITLYQAKGWLLTEDTIDDVLPNGSSYTEHVMTKDLTTASHVAANRQTWDDDAANWVDRGRQSWGAEPHWGLMAIPETKVNALPQIAARDVIELGCGTGYVSSWCLAAGAARVVGLDNAFGQLRSAQQLQGEFNRPFPLIWADAERLPIADNTFDVAINEYGAALWCDPYKWIPEAARVLRPGGSLMFLVWSNLLAMTAPDFDHERTSTQLLRSQQGLRQVTFPDTEGVEFVLSHGEWIALLTQNCFVVDRLIELYAPDADQGGPDRYSYFDAAWARRWPPEEIWCATLTG